MVVDEIQGENRVKGRIFRLGRFEQICQQKKKGGSYGERKLKIKGVMGVKFFQEAGKDPECKSEDAKPLVMNWEGRIDFFKKCLKFFLSEISII